MNTLEIQTDKPFGHRNAPGVQRKGAYDYNGKHYFIKLDDINPQYGSFEDKFDYHYSSVSEAIVSTFVRNIQKFDSVDYQFRKIKVNGNMYTSTISENYLKENEMEIILSTGNTNNENSIITYEEYDEQVFSKDPQTRLDALVNYATEIGVPEDQARDFFIKQTAFDILTGNTDRIGNPSNFVFAYNVKTKQARPINMDYGRCLRLELWQQTYEDLYQEDYLDEDLPEYVKNTFAKNESLVSHHNWSESLQFLKDNGFKGFQIDLNQFYKDLDNLQDVFEDTPFQKFARVKTKNLSTHLSTRTIQRPIRHHGDETRK